MKVTDIGFSVARFINAAALFLALLHWPYSYYQILRWATCIISIYGAFLASKADCKTWRWIFVAMAVLFNPVAPIYLSRAIWRLADSLAAIILLLSVPAMWVQKAPIK